jgi:general L-amino acid transport system substrate-binding protein
MPLFIFFFSLLVFPAVSLAESTVETIHSRGYLKCGVNMGLPGFSVIAENGQWQGFDVDFCRAIAVSILGDAKKVEFVGLDSKSRFAALAAKEVDVVVRNTTWNRAREMSLNILFTAVNFFDGQGVMVPKALGVEKIEQLDGASICVLQGTTSEVNIASVMAQKKIQFQPLYFEKPEQMIRSYEAKRCDAMTADRSQLFALRSITQNPDEQVILDEVVSSEPLAPFVRDDDADFFKLVRWVVFSTIEAEKLQMTAENMEKLAKENPAVANLLTVGKAQAEPLGMKQDFVQRILREVGNYGQIYDRYFGTDGDLPMPRSQNALWSEGCGLMFAMPS